METKRELEIQVMTAGRDYGISSVLVRNAIGRKLGLNITDSECLSLLSIRGISTPTEIGRYTGLTSGSTTAMLDRLEKIGYISRKPNPNDRRGVLVEINRKWTETVGPLVGGLQKMQNELIASYSDEELAIIADYLTRFSQNVIAHTEMIETDMG